MLESTPYHRLQEHSIVRSPQDNGTLFPGDTLFYSNAEFCNFSQEEHTCRVSKVTQAFSSHAGTHADNPSHFHPSPDCREFSQYVYQGEAVIIDVSKRLMGQKAITRTMIEEALADIVTLRKASQRRVLIRTNEAEKYPDAPTDQFVHFSKDAARFLADERLSDSRLPWIWDLPPTERFGMIGIDTPSVDHPTEKDLMRGVHGIFYDARIAIVENVDLGRQKPAQGTLVTIFDPKRRFPDAKGIAEMYFFPSQQS